MKRKNPFPSPNQFQFQGRWGKLIWRGVSLPQTMARITPQHPRTPPGRNSPGWGATRAPHSARALTAVRAHPAPPANARRLRLPARPRGPLRDALASDAASSRGGAGRGRGVTARLFKMSAGGERSGRPRARERAALRRGGRPGAPWWATAPQAVGTTGSGTRGRTAGAMATCIGERIEVRRAAPPVAAAGRGGAGRGLVPLPAGVGGSAIPPAPSPRPHVFAGSGGSAAAAMAAGAGVSRVSGAAAGEAAGRRPGRAAPGSASGTAVPAGGCGGGGCAALPGPAAESRRAPSRYPRAASGFARISGVRGLPSAGGRIRIGRGAAKPDWQSPRLTRLVCSFCRISRWGTSWGRAPSQGFTEQYPWKPAWKWPSKW